MAIITKDTIKVIHKNEWALIPLPVYPLTENQGKKSEMNSTIVAMPTMRSTRLRWVALNLICGLVAAVGGGGGGVVAVAAAGPARAAPQLGQNAEPSGDSV